MNDSRAEKPLLIGHLAKAANVTADSIRFYERKGLLAKPHRLTSGYRAYDHSAVKRLAFIKQAQALGFSLDDIRRILGLREQGEPACDCVIQIARQTLEDNQAKLRELERFVHALRRRLQRWTRLKAGKKNVGAEFCALIESTKVQ